jgi:NAD+ kinase
MLADQVRRVGLLANAGKPAVASAVRRAAALVAAAGREVLTEPSTADIARLRVPRCDSPAALAASCDLVLVFGGDGTMLRAARELAGSRTPILGVKFGGLGFLTAFSADQLARGLKRVWAGDFTIESRPLIEVDGFASGEPVRSLALNDFVVSRGATSRLIELGVAVNGEPLTTYLCDGLIVSSPTGSTAYSLAAGGAIVSPEAEVFTLTPICPHTVSNRSVIVSLRSEVRVTLHSRQPDSILAADGQVLAALDPGESITVRRSRRSVRLLRLSGASFYRTLRQKLNWSGSNV